MKRPQVIRLPTVNREDVRQKIADLAKNESSAVYFLSHAEDRMVERNITRRQAFKVLSQGELVDSPHWDTEAESGWKCVLRRISAGVEVRVVAKLVDRQSTCCLVVTVFEKD